MGLNIAFDIVHSLLAPPLVAPERHVGVTHPGTVLAFHIALIAFITFQFTAISFYWLGRAWARWVVLAGCIFYLVGLKDLRTDWARSHVIAGVTVAVGAFSLFLLWYLHTRRVREWFRQPATAK